LSQCDVIRLNSIIKPSAVEHRGCHRGQIRNKQWRERERKTPLWCKGRCLRRCRCCPAQYLHYTEVCILSALTLFARETWNYLLFPLRPPVQHMIFNPSSLFSTNTAQAVAGRPWGSGPIWKAGRVQGN